MSRAKVKKSEVYLYIYASKRERANKKKNKRRVMIIKGDFESTAMTHMRARAR